MDMESIDSLAKAINNFEGGMVLVSHDMRLISQVAKEIWMCDNRTVTKFVGEIADFKMQLRSQLQKGGVIETDGKPIQYAPVALVPITPVSKATVIAAAAAASTSSKGRVLTEEELIMKSRMELADAAIARQRARGSGGVGSDSTVSAGSSSVAVAGGGGGVVPGDVTPGTVDVDVQSLSLMDEDAAAEAAAQEEKLQQRLKRKQEKEARAAVEKREEEERQQRREEKLRDIEEAKVLREEQQREYNEFLIRKAAKDAKKKQEEDEEAARLAEAAAKRKEERDMKKRAKIAARLAAEAAAKELAEIRVRADPWTQEQQVSFENALLELTINSKLDKSARWSRIAEIVGDKTRNQCIARYRFLKEFVLAQNKLEKEDI